MKIIILIIALLYVSWAKGEDVNDLHIYPSEGRHSHDISQAYIYTSSGTTYVELKFKDPNLEKIYRAIHYQTLSSASRMNCEDIIIDIYTPPVLYIKGEIIQSINTTRIKTLEVHDFYFQCPFVLVLGMGLEPFRDPLEEYAIIDTKNVYKFLREIIGVRIHEDPILLYPNILSFFRIHKEIKEPLLINQFEGVYPVLGLSEQGDIKLLLSGNNFINAKPLFNNKEVELEFMRQLRTALQAQRKDKTIPPQIYVVGKVTGKRSDPVKTIKIYSWK